MPKQWKGCGLAAALGMTLALGAVRAEAAPRRVLIVGDSMMRIPAHSLTRELDSIEDVESRAFTSLGSGLARLDAFDWMAKLRELIGEFDPDMTVAWFGANDWQPIKVGAEVFQPGSPGWATEYARRIGQAMDILTAREGARLHWLELPDMREARLRENIDAIRLLVQAEAERRSSVVYVPTRPLLSRREGVYSPYVIGDRGLPLQVRDADGVHLNRAGADLMARHLRTLWFPEAESAQP